MIFAFFTLKAQNDSIIVNELKIDTVITNFSNKTKNPGRAALFSAILPGSGQAYNGSYWKVPIVYTILGSVVYFAENSNRQYKRYLKAYIAVTDSLPSTVSEFGEDIKEDELLSYKDTYRRNRDLYYIFTFVVYGLNIVEANVDAHFSDFDVDDDLSLKISPSIIQSYDGKFVPAVYLGFRFWLKLLFFFKENKIKPILLLYFLFLILNF